MNNRLLIRNLAAQDTSNLVNQALDLGIDIPRYEHWWYDDSAELIDSGVKPEQLGYAMSRFLTDEGIAGMKRLIRTEKRKNFEWKVKIIATLISALTGLIGALIGFEAIRR